LQSGPDAITPDVAKALAPHKGSLTLYSGRTFSEEAAGALAKQKGGLTLPSSQTVGNQENAYKWREPHRPEW